MKLIHFSANLEGVKIKEEKANPAPEDVKKVIAAAHNVVSMEIYKFAPLKQKEIELAAASSLKTITDFKSFKQEISQIKPGKLQDELRQFSTPTLKEDDEKKNELRVKGAAEMAFNYYLMLLLNKAFPVEMPKASAKPEKNELRFVASVDLDDNGVNENWTVIRKANLDVASKGEVLATMIAISNAVNGKIPIFSTEKSKFEELEQKYVPETGGKSFAKMAAALQAVDENDLDSLKEKLLQRLLIVKLLTAFNFNPFNAVDTFNDAFPELKIAKPKGNYGGKKKK